MRTYKGVKRVESGERPWGLFGNFGPGTDVVSLLGVDELSRVVVGRSRLNRQSHLREEIARTFTPLSRIANQVVVTADENGHAPRMRENETVVSLPKGHPEPHRDVVATLKRVRYLQGVPNHHDGHWPPTERRSPEGQ